MMRSLLYGLPKKRKSSINREYPPGCGPNVSYTNQPYCEKSLAQPPDNSALNIGLSGSENVSELVNSSEFQQLVNNRVNSERMKSELNDSLDVWVGKELTATLKANGVDLSSILVEKVLETITQESHKQFFGVENQAVAYRSKTISGVGSTSNEIMPPEVAKQSFPPEGPIGYSTKTSMDIASMSEGKIFNNCMTNIPEMSSAETKFPNRRVSVNREYPPFCGRNAPCPTEEKFLSIISGKKISGKEVIGSHAREVFSEAKKLEELSRGKEVIGVSAQRVFQKTKKLKEPGMLLKETARNNTKNNTVREVASTSKQNNLLGHAKRLNLIKGSQNINMRDKVKDTLTLFRTIRDELLQQEKDIRRVDLEAAKMIKEKGKEVNTERQWIGSVPGVEVGDEFLYRVELMIVGVHRLPQGGIDYMKSGRVIVATSIIASGGYSDVMADADVLIYCGQGGNITGRNNKPPKDQEMEKGNLALKNCISTRTNVRVIRGFETKTSNMRARTYTYDGLYTVEKFWSEMGQHRKLVFKFELRRVPGQPIAAWKRNEVKFRDGYY